MELQQMRYAVAVAEERNFTRAAERCHVVQSALSHQIKALERELGVQLFARTSRRVEVTPAGEAFVAAARVSLDAAERAIGDAAAATGVVRGSLTIGVIPTVTAIDIPAILGKFHAAHPRVVSTLRGGGSDALIAELESGTLDLAVLGLPSEISHPRIATRILARERLVLAVAAGHPLVDRRGVRLEDLAEQTFVDFPTGTPGRQQTDLAFAAAGLSRVVQFEVTSVDILLGLVAHGLAVAFLPSGLVPEHGPVTAVAVRNAPTRVEYLAWSNFNPSPAALAFLAMSGAHAHVELAAG